MEKGKNLIKNSVIVIFGTVLTKCLNFIMAPLFTRWLSVEDYGAFDIIVMYSTFLIPIIAFGIHHALFRYMLDGNTKNKITTINTNAIFINVIGFLIYIIFVIPIYILYKKIRNYLFLLTLLFIFQSLHNYLNMFVRGLKKLKVYSISNILCTLNSLIFVYLFVYKYNCGLNGMILGYCFGYLSASLYIIILTKFYKYIKLKYIDYKMIKNMIKYSLPMIPNSIAWWLVNLSDRMIVNIFLGPLYNGILAVAHKIPNLCVTLYEGFQTAWVENASESIKDNDWNEYFNKTLNILCQLSLSIAILIVTTNFFLFDILFTKEYILGKNLIPLFAVATVFNTLSQTIGSVFIAKYNSKVQGKTMIEAGIINIIVHVILIKWLGVYASVISTIVAYLYLFIIRFRIINREYKIYLHKKSICLLILLLIFVLISYLNFTIFNYFVLLISIICCILFNNDTLKILFRKFFNRRFLKK